MSGKFFRSFPDFFLIPVVCIYERVKRGTLRTVVHHDLRKRR